MIATAAALIPVVSSEDPYMWQDDDGRYHMLAKAMGHELVASQTGFYASSENGTDWHLGNSPQAYEISVTWDDGSNEVLLKRERPQVLIEDGQPTAVFFATRRHNNEIFSLGIPLKRDLPKP